MSPTPQALREGDAPLTYRKSTELETVGVFVVFYQISLENRSVMSTKGDRKLIMRPKDGMRFTEILSV